MKPWLSITACLGLTSLALGLGAIESNTQVVAQTSTPPVIPKPMPTISAKVEEFRVSGTEPFWGITISRRGIIYTTPDAKPKTFPYVAPIAAQGRPIDFLRMYRLPGNQMLVIKKGMCSDGMSDRQYPYSATLILGNTVQEGCAEKK